MLLRRKHVRPSFPLCIDDVFDCCNVIILKNA